MDGEVIPMEPRARKAAGANGAVLAAADRASGEREQRRRRTTPLLAEREQASAQDRPAEKAPAKKAAAKKAAAEKAPAKKAAARKTAAAQGGAQKAPAKKAGTPSAKLPVTKAASKTPSRTAKKTVRKSAAKRTTVDPRVDETLPAEPPGPPPVPAASEEAAPPQRPTPDWVLEARAAAAADRESRGTKPPVEGGEFSLAAGVAAQAGQMILDALGSARRAADVHAPLAAALEFAGRRVSGEYDVDEFGFDAEFTDAVWLNILRPIYRRWFRVEVRGIENIPAEGGALVVANHSGALPLDALMTSVAVHDEHPEHRFLRTLGADLVFETPFLAGLARKAGATLATNADAERLLADGHVVGVWPEGFKGIGKPFTERYKLQRFGRGGFVSAALRTRTPIVPCSIVGAEEIFPIVADVPALARLLGIPYLPITPFFPLLGPLGMVPLPSKWLIEFGPPVPTDEYGPAAAEDPMLVFDLTDRVRQTIQQTLYSLLVQRRSIFF